MTKKFYLCARSQKIKFPYSILEKEEKTWKHMVAHQEIKWENNGGEGKYVRYYRISQLEIVLIELL